MHFGQFLLTFMTKNIQRQLIYIIYGIVMFFYGNYVSNVTCIYQCLNFCEVMRGCRPLGEISEQGHDLASI